MNVTNVTCYLKMYYYLLIQDSVFSGASLCHLGSLSFHFWYFPDILVKGLTPRHQLHIPRRAVLPSIVW
jgi:hypothetical protein